LGQVECVETILRAGGGSLLSRLLSVVFIIYCFEVGIFLVLLPWFSVWENNLLVHRYALIRSIALNGYAKGAVTGLGLSNLVLGVLEIVQFRKSRQAEPPH
jgi:hypothetical protein